MTEPTTQQEELEPEQNAGNMVSPVDIVTFLQASPLAKAIAEGCEFNLGRQLDLPRDIDFD